MAARGLSCGPAPIVVALGDSVTSGHHQETTGLHLRICDDPNYSYPYYLWQRLHGQNRRWTYANHAHSGFTTDEVITGGTNACGQGPFRSPPPLAQAVHDLTTHRGAGNKVVLTAGVDDTNWVSVIEKAFLHQNSSPDCFNYISRTWNGPGLRAHISANVSRIINTLVQADPSVRISWVSYYNMAGTGGTVHLSALCQGGINYGVQTLGGAIRVGIRASTHPGSVTFVDIDTPAAMHMNAGHTQPLSVAVGVIPQPNYLTLGWPHPNTPGHQAIARLIP